MLRQDRARRAVVGANVLEHRAVAGLLRMMIDDEIGAVQEPSEVVGLHIDRRDPLELLKGRRRNLLDVDVQHVRHPQILRARDPLNRTDDGRRLRASEQVSQRETAGERIGIGIVVEQDQDPVGVVEIALVLLYPRARHRPAQLGDERRADQLAEADVSDVRLGGAGMLGRLVGLLAGVQDVDERSAGVSDRRDRLFWTATVVFDDEARAGRDVGLEVGVDPPRIADGDLDPGVVETARQGPAFDEEIHLEARQQYVVQGANEELVLTDGKNAHVRLASPLSPTAGSSCRKLNYTPCTRGSVPAPAFQAARECSELPKLLIWP